MLRTAVFTIVVLLATVVLVVSHPIYAPVAVLLTIAAIWAWRTHIQMRHLERSESPREISSAASSSSSRHVA